MRTVDNQFHLQVLRHMYVLATENRALHTIDVDSGLPVSVPVEVVSTSGDIRQFVAPGLLPELATIKEIRVSVTNSAIETLDCDIAEDSEKSYDSFYPTSIVLNGNDSSSILRHNNSAVPPLYVKKIVSKQSVPAQGKHFEICTEYLQ